ADREAQTRARIAPGVAAGERDSGKNQSDRTRKERRAREEAIAPPRVPEPRWSRQVVLPRRRIHVGVRQRSTQAEIVADVIVGQQERNQDDDRQERRDSERPQEWNEAAAQPVLRPRDDTCRE